jgi:hypothetical protein
MNTKFDSFISEMMGSEGSSETDVIRSIRQDLTKSSSNLDNFASQFERSSPKAMAIRQAMMKVDAARNILINLQD